MQGIVVFSTGSDAEEGNHTCTLSLADGDTLELVIQVLNEVKVYKRVFQSLSYSVTQSISQ